MFDECTITCVTETHKSTKKCMFKIAAFLAILKNWEW
jgi:hypothetical protein